MKQQTLVYTVDNFGTTRKELHCIRQQSRNIRLSKTKECQVRGQFVYLPQVTTTADGPNRSRNYGIESGCHADKQKVSHVKGLVYMYKYLNKKSPS